MYVRSNYGRRMMRDNRRMRDSRDEEGERQQDEEGEKTAGAKAGGE